MFFFSAAFHFYFQINENISTLELSLKTLELLSLLYSYLRATLIENPFYQLYQLWNEVQYKTMNFVLQKHPC